MIKEYVHKDYLTRRFDTKDRKDSWWISRGYLPVDKDKNYKDPEFDEEIFQSPPSEWEFSAKMAYVTYRYKKLPPTLVITSVDSSKPDKTSISENLNDITCPVGTTLTFGIDLRINEHKLDTVTEQYRTPIRARDGREKIVSIDLINGEAVVKVTMRESGCWEIAEDMINESLPDDQYMCFAGVRVFVVDVADGEE